MIEVRDVVGISFQFEDPDQSSSSVSIRFDKTATISTTDNDEEPKPKAKTRTLSPFVAIQPVEVHGGAASRAEFIDVLSIVRFNRHSNELEMVTGKVYRVTEDDLRRVLERLDQIGMIPLLD